ncbi:MAG: type VI secretion system baseplate subunit TssK [Polyangiales bacterium]
MTLTVTDKVAWAEGVLLRPQHFQQLDRYHESLLSARLDALDVLNWGAISVEIDERALQSGSVALTAFEGIMPDGTPVVLDAGQADAAAPKQRPLGEHFPPAQKSLVVYLAIPNERTGVTNYAPDGDQLRYQLRARKIPDAARDDRHADIQLATPNLRLLFAGEQRDGFSALPIAKIVRDEAGTPVLSRSYIPPCLRIRCSAVIARRLDQLLTGMIGRFRILSDARRITGENRVEFNAADVTRYLQLHALNGMFPALFHLARGAEVSPRTAFLLLSQLAGQLATFAPDGDMTNPLDFDFNDLESSFANVFDLCEHLLAALDTERYVSCQLLRQSDGRFYADLNDVRIDSCRRFFLGVESQLPRALITQEITQRAKLASHGDIEFVLSRNVSGIRVVNSDRPPSQLPTRPGLSYFELPTPDEDVYWKHVRKDHNLVVWLPPGFDTEQCSVQLYGLIEEKTRG